MKRLALLSLMMITVSSAFSQEKIKNGQPFKLNCDGFVSNHDYSKSFVAIDFSHLNLSSEALKQKAIAFIEENHSKVTKLEKNDKTIVVEGLLKNKILLPYGFDMQAQDLHYKATYEIKDNALHLSIGSIHAKLDKPVTYGRYTSIVNASNTYIKADERFGSNNKGIYSNGCKLQRPMEKQLLEKWASDYVNQLYTYVSNMSPYSNNLLTLD